VSKARLVITAVVVGGRGVRETARNYKVSPGWVSRLVARYRVEGEAAFERRSRRPRTSRNAISASTVELIIQLRGELTRQGLDAGPHTIAWHLAEHHQLQVSAATIWRTLKRNGLIAPEPAKETEGGLCAVRRRAAQRNVAGRFHPLLAHPARRVIGHRGHRGTGGQHGGIDLQAVASGGPYRAHLRRRAPRPGSGPHASPAARAARRNP